MYRFGTGMFLLNPYIFASGGPALDPDADAFITAAAITDPTEISAVNQLVLDMKTANIWTKMKAVYPFVGGTATTHKWNLKDPRDLDAAFRLTFSGGWTHSSTGALPNGTNAYADTYLNALNELSITSFAMGVYLNSTLISNRYSIGWSGGLSNNISAIRANNSSTKTTYLQYSTLPLQKTLSNVSEQRGFWGISMRASNDRALICQDATFVYRTDNGTGTHPNINCYLAAYNNNGAASQFDTMSHAFDFISDGLNDTELTDLRTAVINFQTTLGRAV